MIKSTGIIRKVDSVGRVVLPVEMREQLGIREKEGLEIFMDEEKRRIIFEKSSKECLKCRSTIGLKQIKPGFYLCRNCIDELK